MPPKLKCDSGGRQRKEEGQGTATKRQRVAEEEERQAKEAREEKDEEEVVASSRPFVRASALVRATSSQTSAPSGQQRYPLRRSSGGFLFCLVCLLLHL